jgi:hypothetical protein
VGELEDGDQESGVLGGGYSDDAEEEDDATSLENVAADN